MPAVSANVDDSVFPQIAPALLGRKRVALLLVMLFTISIAIRLPLFNKEMTTNWEALSAHVLITSKAWFQTPSSIHHFNLLFTFARPQDKFIKDIGDSGVEDRFGNYYYTSMPHLAYILPHLFFVAIRRYPSIAGLQVFGLLLHFVSCVLLYNLVRRLTTSFRSSQVASLAAVCFLLFAPQSLFYFQNGVVGNTVIVPFTLALLLSTTALLSKVQQGGASLGVFALVALWLMLGLWTDWHEYFYAMSIAIVFLFLAKKGLVPRSVGLKVAALCCGCVILAVSVFVWQNSRIAGFDPFFHAIFGRLNERLGKSPSGMGLNSFGYYQNVARFYSAYVPFFMVIGALIASVIRKGSGPILRNVFVKQGVPFWISVLAVALDHLVLANHTAAHCFKTIDDLVPLSILLGFSVAAFLETTVDNFKTALAVCTLLLGCVAASAGIYYSVYLNRPHPFRAAASSILASAQANDVLFCTSGGAAAKPLLNYLGRNVKIVSDAQEAAAYLSCHRFQHGILITLADDWKVKQIGPILPSISGCQNPHNDLALPR
jgi:hypothetical protein